MKGSFKKNKNQRPEPCGLTRCVGPDFPRSRHQVPLTRSFRALETRTSSEGTTQVETP